MNAAVRTGPTDAKSPPSTATTWPGDVPDALTFATDLAPLSWPLSALLGPGSTARAEDEDGRTKGFETPLQRQGPHRLEARRRILDGKTESADHRFAAKDGVLACRGANPIKVVETTRAFPGDFVLRLEFRASPKANSGLFLRGKQLQVRDYPTVGPYKTLKHFQDGDWNAIEVTVTGRRRPLHLQRRSSGRGTSGQRQGGHRSSGGDEPARIPTDPHPRTPLIPGAAQGRARTRGRARRPAPGDHGGIEVDF